MRISVICTGRVYPNRLFLINAHLHLGSRPHTKRWQNRSVNWQKKAWYLHKLVFIYETRRASHRLRLWPVTRSFVSSNRRVWHLNCLKTFTCWSRRPFRCASISTATARTRMPNSGLFLSRVVFIVLPGITKRPSAFQRTGNMVRMWSIKLFFFWVLPRILYLPFWSQNCG